MLDDVRGSRSGLETRTLKLGMTGHHILHKTVIGREMAVTSQVGGRNMWVGGLNSVLIFLSVFKHEYGVALFSLHPGHRVTLFDVGVQ